MDDDSRWHYYGYTDDEEEEDCCGGSSSSSDEEDAANNVLRYEPSEFGTELSYHQINDESEIFTREQLARMALESQSEPTVVKDDEEDDADEEDSAKRPRTRPRPVKPQSTSDNFYASGPETDSEGEQSKHEIESSPPRRRRRSPLHNNTTTSATSTTPPTTTAKTSPNNNCCEPEDDPVVPVPVPQFSRSTVGGSKAQPTAHPNAFEPDDLIFESRFESGNLGRAIKITPTYYELYLRPDMYTNRHTQWFYFRVKNTKAKTVYR